MPIAPSFYSNQLPAVCRSLAERAYGAVSSYHAGSRSSSADVVDTLENVFRLLELYRSDSLIFDNPSGVLGVDPSLAAEIPSRNAEILPTLLVQETLDKAFRQAYGDQVNQEDAVEQLESVLGAVAYHRGTVDDSAFSRAEMFFETVRDRLAQRPSTNFDAVA